MIKLDAQMARALEAHLEELEDFIREDLAPQFVSAKMDPESGAIVVPGWPGNPVLAAYQCNVVRAGTALEQHGLFAKDARRLSTRATDFIVRNLWDDDHGGWLNLPAEETEKCTGTQAAVMAALAEYLMVSGDFEVAERLAETFKTLQVFAADNAIGGYAARFTRNWSVIESGQGADPMLAEAMALAFVALGTEVYRRRASDALTRIADSPSLSVEELGPILAVADLVVGPESGLVARLVYALERVITSATPRDEGARDARSTAELEAWRLARQTPWLERVADRLSGGGMAQAVAGPHDSNPADAWSLLPRVIRREALLVKALFGSK